MTQEQTLEIINTIQDVINNWRKAPPAPVVNGHYGLVVLMDCIKAMKLIPSQSIDLCLTDPPYGVKVGKLKKDFDRVNNKHVKHPTPKIVYEDIKEDYLKFSTEWFTEVTRICREVIFTPGTGNIEMWHKIQKPKETLIWYKPNGVGFTHGCHFNQWEPILVYGHVSNFQFRSNVFMIPLNNRRGVELGLQHVCPKEFKLFDEIIRQVKPTSVLDCFIGSGLTAAVCEKRGIPYIGFDLPSVNSKNENYIHDITANIKDGIDLHKTFTPEKTTRFRKRTQRTLFGISTQTTEEDMMEDGEETNE